jgi:hypothetical protein
MEKIDHIKLFCDSVRDANAAIIAKGGNVVPHVITCTEAPGGQLLPVMVRDVSHFYAEPGGKDALAAIIFNMAAHPSVAVVVHVTECWVRELKFNAPKTKADKAKQKKKLDEVVRAVAEEGLEGDPEKREALNLHAFTADCQFISTSMIDRQARSVAPGEWVTVASTTPEDGGTYHEGRFIRHRPRAN